MMRSLSIISILLVVFADVAAFQVSHCDRLTSPVIAKAHELPDTAPLSSSGQKFGWDKRAPKKSLKQIGKDSIASGWMLNLVEVMHWSTFPPAFISCFAIVSNYEVWANLFSGDSLRLTLWTLYPLIQQSAGLPTIIAHIYEDWQITPTKDPSNDAYDPSVYTNELLRGISYELLFTGLGLASIVAFHAYQGLALAPLNLAMLAYAILGDRNHRVSSYLKDYFPNHTEITVMPLPVCKMIFFAYSQILAAAFVFVPLSSQVDSFVLKAAIVLPQFFFALGGTIEALKAEINFDQRYHLAASFQFFVGVSLQAWFLFEIGEYLS